MEPGEFRPDKPYDEETVTHIRFPDGSICDIPHAPATIWGPLGGIVAREALDLHLEKIRHEYRGQWEIPAESPG